MRPMAGTGNTYYVTRGGACEGADSQKEIVIAPATDNYRLPIKSGRIAFYVT